AYGVAAYIAATVWSRRKRPGKTPILARLPRLWALFPYLLSNKTREQNYEPAKYDLEKDHVLAKRNFRTKGARRWLTFCFCLRTAVLFFGSIKAALGDKFI